jgi:hypothetical protein
MQTMTADIDEFPRRRCRSEVATFRYPLVWFLVTKALLQRRRAPCRALVATVSRACCQCGTRARGTSDASTVPVSSPPSRPPPDVPFSERL